jgi:hypothetical protein
VHLLFFTARLTSNFCSRDSRRWLSTNAPRYPRSRGARRGHGLTGRDLIDAIATAGALLARNHESRNAYISLWATPTDPAPMQPRPLAW